VVKGLDVFINQFEGFSEQYVLIGGTACHIAFDIAGYEFRATKDLDIVLCAEALTKEFVDALLEFIDTGAYEIREKSSGHRQLHRFSKPKRTNYPAMIELFSRSSGLFPPVETEALTPIRVEDEVVSLSAILLDDDYYDWILRGRDIVQDVPIVAPEYVIPLKARAWLDLTERKRAGQTVDTNNIKKHRNDVFRLLAIVRPQELSGVPSTISADIRAFLDRATSEAVDYEKLGLGRLASSEVADILRTIYRA